MMKAAWLERQELSFRENHPIPQLKNGEALIQVHLAGICATDLEMVRGYYPFTGIPGHEFVGEVVEAPDKPELVGKRVVGEINIVCGACEACRAGRPTHCERRTVLGILGRDGVFAEYLSLPLANLHIVPESVPDEAAVFTEPLAAALEIQQQIQVKPGDRVLLIGAGRLGQLVAQTIALTGCDLKVVTRHKYQNELLAMRKIETLSEGGIVEKKADVVIEATGSESGFALARKAVRPRGTIVLKSTYKGDVRLNLSSLVVDEITLLGSRCGPFAPALRLLESGEIDPTPLIRRRYSIEDVYAAFDCAGQPGALKVLLQPASL
jgi:threonine dehydrogenase-like Zn-dependent dehydrogenase